MIQYKQLKLLATIIFISCIAHKVQSLQTTVEYQLISLLKMRQLKQTPITVNNLAMHLETKVFKPEENKTFDCVFQSKMLNHKDFYKGQSALSKYLRLSTKSINLERAKAAFGVLQKQWWNETMGQWEKPWNSSEHIDWWHTANGMEILANFYSQVQDKELQKLFVDVIERRFITEYKERDKILADFSYDDQGWMALGWLRAYEQLKDVKYLHRAEFWWKNIQQDAWDRDKKVCGAGLFWAGDPKKQLYYKNAIENSLFIRLSARLYSVTEKQQYLDWALKTWNWFESTKLIDSSYLIHDGLNHTTCQIKQNNIDFWSYNSGVLIGGLAELYSITKNETLVPIIEKVTQAAIEKLPYKEYGILVAGIGDAEPGPGYEAFAKGQGASEFMFKGILIRHIGYLKEIMSDVGEDWDTPLSEWIQFQSEEIVELASMKDGTYDWVWSWKNSSDADQQENNFLQKNKAQNPFDRKKFSHAASQLQAIDAFLTANQVNKQTKTHNFSQIKWNSVQEFCKEMGCKVYFNNVQNDVQYSNNGNYKFDLICR